jgi:hypothetical protein
VSHALAALVPGAGKVTEDFSFGLFLVLISPPPDLRASTVLFFLFSF